VRRYDIVDIQDECSLERIDLTMKRLIRSLLSVVLFFSMLASCSVGKDAAAIDSEVSRIHGLFEAGKLHDVYSGSDPELKNATSEKDFVDLLTAVSGKLGGLQTSKRTNLQVNYVPTGKFVSATFESKFSNGMATEQFRFKLTGADYKMVGYNIESNALLLNGR